MLETLVESVGKLETITIYLFRFLYLLFYDRNSGRVWRKAWNDADAKTEACRKVRKFSVAKLL